MIEINSLSCHGRVVLCTRGVTAAVHDKSWAKQMRRSIWKPKEPCVYILASAPDGVLYIGVTSAIFDRMLRHQSGIDGGFTARYNVTRLVYCEFHASMRDAIARESQLKKWKRAWKVRLIKQTNPEWQDLFNRDDGIYVAPSDREPLEK